MMRRGTWNLVPEILPTIVELFRKLHQNKVISNTGRGGSMGTSQHLNDNLHIKKNGSIFIEDDRSILISIYHLEPFEGT